MLQVFSLKNIELQEVMLGNIRNLCQLLKHKAEGKTAFQKWLKTQPELCQSYDVERTVRTQEISLESYNVSIFLSKERHKPTLVCRLSVESHTEAKKAKLMMLSKAFLRRHLPL